MAEPLAAPPLVVPSYGAEEPGGPPPPSSSSAFDIEASRAGAAGGEGGLAVLPTVLIAGKRADPKRLGIAATVLCLLLCVTIHIRSICSSHAKNSHIDAIRPPPARAASRTP